MDADAGIDADEGKETGKTKIKCTYVCVCGGWPSTLCGGGGGCRCCGCKEEGIKMKLAYQLVSAVVVTFGADGRWRSGGLVSVNRHDGSVTLMI